MPAHFPAAEDALLRALPGVGEGLLRRLQQCGIASLAELARQDEVSLTARLALANCSPCWETSPKARQRVRDVIALAQHQVGVAAAVMPPQEPSRKQTGDSGFR